MIRDQRDERNEPRETTANSTNTNNTNSTNTNEGFEANENQSRRQRLFGLARTARDVYIPRLSDSVSQIATGVSNRAFNNDKFDAQGRIRIPKDATITLFPTYTRKSSDGTYHVDVGGWLSCPGLMTRKNRLVFSLVKQIIRYDSAATASQQAINNLESEKLQQDIFNDSSDTETISSMDSMMTDPGTAGSGGSAASGSRMRSNEDVLRERLSYFIARFIANAELTVTVGSVEDMDTKDLKSVDVFTDQNGCFNVCVNVNYEPSVVQVVAKLDDTVFTFSDLDIVSSNGIAVISDIDDTVKLTGVIGDKRDLLSSLLLKDVESWKIASITKWYEKLLHNKVTFHYVSNSPVQLFPTILKYFKAVGLPLGSLHLKQYTGNIFSSIMEPSRSRKKTALTKIANDFPQKKFICIGDSGEYDFESYVDLAKNYPDRVLGIFIRYVPGSLSDIDEWKIFNELNRLFKTRKVEEVKIKEAEMADLIDLSDSSTTTSISRQRASKLPPMVPKKPQRLRASSTTTITTSSGQIPHDLPPPLPSRPSRPMSPLSKSHTDTDLTHVPPPVNRLQRPTASNIPDLDNPTKQELLDNLQNIYYSHHFEDLREIDETGASWIERAMAATKALAASNVTVRFFNDDDQDLYETSYDVIKDIIEKENK